MTSEQISKDYQKALELFEQHRLEEAVILLRGVVTEEPGNAYAHNDLGSVCFYLALDEEAERSLLRAVELLPTDEIILRNCVEVFRAFGKTELCEKYSCQLAGEEGASEGEPEPHAIQSISSSLLDLSEPTIEERGQPRVTLGIPTRNRLEPLLTLLASVQQQTFQNFELLISDDGGIADLEGKIREAFPNLSFRYLTAPGVSLPVNRQFILDSARTEFVVMCDDDHFMDPLCLQELVTTITADDQIGIVSAIWPHPYENPPTVEFEKVRERDDYRLDLDNIHRGGDFWWKNGCEMFKAFQREPQVFESQFAGGGCLIYRKSAVVAVGGFPTDYSVVSFREDTDLSHRVFLRGYRVLVNSKALAYHLRAESGGCKDTKEWEELFVRDGLLFLEKLERWREEQSERLQLSADGSTIRLVFFYDEKGWAWWHRAHQIKRHLSSKFTVDILQLGTPFDWREYDFVVLFDHNLIDHIPAVPAERLVIGNSCPKLLDGAIEAVQNGRCFGGFVNNASGYTRAKEFGRFFCCQNGVDTELFYPPAEPPGEFVACWTGNSNSIGNKGLELIRAACAAEGVELLVVDAATKVRGVEAHPQSWLRDNLYHRASVFICASEFEGTPNPGLEALACGVPVISTAVGNMSEVIVDGYNGYLVERSAEAIASAVRKLRGADIAEMRRNARTTVLYGWSWREQIKKYEAMFEELLREHRFGRKAPPSVALDAVRRTVESRMRPQQKPLLPIDSYIEGVEGKFIFLDSALRPNSLESSCLERAAYALQSMKRFYLHFGGVGDAMLLLSTIPEGESGFTVLSVATNIEASKAFWSEIPQAETVCLLEFPNDEGQRLLRFLCGGLPNCLGMGVTSSQIDYRDWKPGVDLERSFRVNPHPKWVKQFSPRKLVTPQVTVAPRGSLAAMQAERRNQIDPTLWEAILRMLLASGVEPVIIGTPNEREEYPALQGCRDERSFSFREQMELIAGSELFIGADSWGKTFAALLGLPTIVFPPMLYGSHQLGCDASAHIFLEPWRTLTQVTNFDEFCDAFEAVSSHFLREQRASAKRSVRILMLARSNVFTQRGGDTIVLEKTIGGLKQRGAHVDLDLNRETDLAAYDVVGLANFSQRELVARDAKLCIDAGVPYVVHTMYEDWPKFFGQMSGSAQLIEHYLKLGQKRETWPQFEKVLKRIEPTGIWDNSFAALNAAMLIASGVEEERVLCRDYPGAKVRVVHYGCGPATEGDGGELFRREYGIEDYVLCVGRLESRKNQHLLLKALEDSSRTVVFLTGGFSYQPEYSEVCRKFQRLGKSVFLDRLPDEMLRSAYSGARVHALPSFYELPGLVSIEAAVHGAQIVVSDYGTIRDYVGDHAFYCEPTDPQDILRAIEEACQAPTSESLRERLSGFSWGAYFDQVLAVYEEVGATRESDSPIRLSL